MDPVEIAQRLISVDSVTTQSNLAIANVQHLILEELGFEVHRLEHRDLAGAEKIVLAARRADDRVAASAEAGIAYFCHNDVVSVEGWNCEHGGPFSAKVAEQRLWGRGACDMKGPTAAAIAAIASLVELPQSAPLYFFITGDEESGMAGARLLTENSSFYREAVERGTVGIIGEPTELHVVNSHKGGCHFDVSSSGVAAHSSTNDGLNANWQLIPFLSYLQQLNHRCQTEPSLQNSNFSTPTLSLNIVIDNEPSAFNITVGRATCHIFFRPMPGTQWESMLEEIKRAARDMELELSSIRCLSPLLTPVDRAFVRTALAITDQDKPGSACYATDGCCFQELPDLIVLGPGSIEQAHRHDEWIAVDQLQRGTELYAKFFQHYAFNA